MTISIQGRRYHVLEDLGFLKKKRAYVRIAVEGLKPRTALKWPGNAHWEWAEDDPLMPSYSTPTPIEPHLQESQE